MFHCRGVAGADRSGFHSCTYVAGAAAGAKIEQQAAGQPGLPKDVTSGLALSRQMVGSSANDFESQAFGAIGCYRFTVSFPGMAATHSTACFAPAGYLVLTLNRQDQKVPLQTVADLLMSALPRAS